MIPTELLAMVRCPATGQTLAPCPAEILSAVNGRVSGSTGNGVVTVGGQVVAEPLTDGLLRADGGVVYPVRDGIPILLVEEGIVLPLP